MSSFVAAIVLALVQPAEAIKENRGETVVRLTNEYRKAEKVAVLKSSKALMEIAQGHADNMASQDKYGDDNKDGHILDGKDMKDRLLAAGYKYDVAAENVAMSHGLKEPIPAAVHAWKKSHAHKSNMTSDQFTETGAGVAVGKSGRWYFVQLFGKPRE